MNEYNYFNPITLNLVNMSNTFSCRY